MKIATLLLLMLLNLSYGYGQFVDSLFYKFSQVHGTLNTTLSDGNDLYLTLVNHKSRQLSVWLFNDLNQNGKELVVVDGQSTVFYDFEIPNPYIFKREGFVYVVAGGYDLEYSSIVKIKQGVVQSTNKVRLKTHSLTRGKSRIYFAGTNDSMGFGLAAYNLATQEKHYFKTPTLPYLKSTAVDTVVFVLKDSTNLYSGFEGRGFKKILACNNPPTDFVDFEDRSYFRYDNSVYVTDASEKGTSILKHYGKSPLLGTYTSPEGVLISVRKSGFAAATFLYNPGDTAIRYIGTSQTSFSQPVNFARNRYIFRGNSFYYVDQTKQDSGFFKTTFNESFVMFDALDYQNSRHYFCLNNLRDTYNFYFVDTSLAIQQLNVDPVTNNTVVLNQLFTHKNELYYLSLIDTSYLIRRFTKPDPSGIKRTSQELGLYPNPSQRTMAVNADFQMNAVTVFNTRGQLMYSIFDIDSKSLTIDVSSFAKGVYFVRASDKTFVSTSRFIKE